MLDISEQVLDSKQNLYLLGNILSRPYLTKQWKKVNLSYCQIDDKKFRILYEVLTRKDGRFKPKIEALSLSDNNLKSCSDDIANLACCQEILHLDLSNNVLGNFTSLQRCDFLVTLDISNNKLDNDNVAISLTALRILRILKILKLKQNNIDNNQDVIDAIGLALCSCSCLEEVELDGNNREFVEKTMLLFKVINEIRNSKSDEHHYNGQPDKASAFLKILECCNKIDYQPNSCTLRNIIIQSKVIDILCNGLEADDGCSLGQNLPLLVKLKTLNIAENNISDEATKSLTIGMLLTPNLEVFHYDKSLFSAESNMIFKIIYQLCITHSNNNFKCALSESKALAFILKCISNLNEEELQSSDIVSTVSHIKELKIHHERIAMDYKLNRDLKELCTVLIWFKKLSMLIWFKKLSVLDAKNNRITVEAKESLAKVMLQIHTFNNLKLNGNPIFNDELSMAVFNNIKNIHEHKLKSIICAQKNYVHIESVICILESLHQLENPTCFRSFNNITTLDTNSESNYGAKFLKYLNFLPFLIILKINMLVVSQMV